MNLEYVHPLKFICICKILFNLLELGYINESDIAQQIHMSRFASIHLLRTTT